MIANAGRCAWQIVLVETILQVLQEHSTAFQERKGTGGKESISWTLEVREIQCMGYLSIRTLNEGRLQAKSKGVGNGTGACSMDLRDNDNWGS